MIAPEHHTVRGTFKPPKNNMKRHTNEIEGRGKHMNHLDILQPRDWFEDRDYDSNGVIIGIPREEVMRGSKRRREDSEER